MADSEFCFVLKFSGTRFVIFAVVVDAVIVVVVVVVAVVVVDMVVVAQGVSAIEAIVPVVSDEVSGCCCCNHLVVDVGFTVVVVVVGVKSLKKYLCVNQNRQRAF